jgi:hypothetical protein
MIMAYSAVLEGLDKAKTKRPVIILKPKEQTIFLRILLLALPTGNGN